VEVQTSMGLQFNLTSFIYSKFVILKVFSFLLIFSALIGKVMKYSTRKGSILYKNFSDMMQGRRNSYDIAALDTNSGPDANGH
jgi:hypothetical protein